MKWKIPSITKVYEALGTIADDRIEVVGNTAKSYSSTRNKFYTIAYDPVTNAIMSNDNSSFYKGELGYPSIALLMKLGVLSYDQSCANILKNIPWKDINQKFENNYEKALDFILSSKTEEERTKLKEFAEKVYKEIKELKISMLSQKTTPPEGY